MTEEVAQAGAYLEISEESLSVAQVGAYIEIGEEEEGEQPRSFAVIVI